MFHVSPHRVRPHLQALIAIATLGLGVLLLPAGRPPSAVPVDTKLQGSVPKAPAFAAGFPIPFWRTVDFRPRQGSVVAADLNGDGRHELVVSVPNGQVVVFHPDGSRIPGWPRTFETLTQPAFPMGDAGVGDLDGDGSPDIVTCVVSGVPMRRNFLYAMRSDGTDLPGWPIELRDTGSDYYSCSGVPTLLADLDGDGNLDVIRAMNHGLILAFDRQGRPLPGWPVRLGPDNNGRVREIGADLLTVDLEGDHHRDLVFVESGLGPRLAAVSGDGRLLPGFPVWLPEIIDRDAPAAADLDGDGRLELVQATMPFYGDSTEPVPEPTAGGALIPAALHVIRPDGSSRPGWPRQLRLGASWGAVLADLDGDGLPEILQQDGGQLLGFDAAGNSPPGFPVIVHRDFVRTQSVSTSPWVVADLNGDRRPDLMQVWSSQYAGNSYMRVFGLRATGNPLRGFPFDADGMLAASRPVLTDLDGDGVNDLVMLISDGANGGWRLVAWNLGSLLRGTGTTSPLSPNPSMPGRQLPGNDQGPNRPS
ncbi:MAG: hypothetical protein AUI47_03625 [Acidobacteria bacterium 13_1_40CM_2_68_5]|nr:MAG: hypothetical protein AUI47_03625 [Acidobacteria bacterium 13_1_40CM_2_68_5]OLE67476.1 MAG: hypothetical protein AUG09_02235 [Acidobacteria bacterium 13_1_20CM_2_68_7]